MWQFVNVWTVKYVHYLRIIYSKQTLAGTRNQGLFFIVPKVRVEFMQGSFFYSGARMFNELSKETREISETKDFKKFLFFWSFMFIWK